MADQNEILNHRDKRRATVRFTEKEFTKVKRMQALMGGSIPDLIREALFKKKKWEQALFTREQADLFYLELRKQGTEIGKMSKIVNEGLRCGWNESFNHLVRGYVDLRHILCLNRTLAPAK